MQCPFWPDHPSSCCLASCQTHNPRRCQPAHLHGPPAPLAHAPHVITITLVPRCCACPDYPSHHCPQDVLAIYLSPLPATHATNLVPYPAKAPCWPALCANQGGAKLPHCPLCPAYTTCRWRPMLHAPPGAAAAGSTYCKMLRMIS